MYYNTFFKKENITYTLNISHLPASERDGFSCVFFSALIRGRCTSELPLELELPWFDWCHGDVAGELSYRDSKCIYVVYIFTTLYNIEPFKTPQFCGLYI